MSRQFSRDALLWGGVLWLIGYVLGFLLFAVVPVAAIGWVITPIGVIVTLWVLVKKIRGTSFQYYAGLAVVWTLIAIACDYVFLVKLLNPPDGYYKADVYLYYALTFVLPLAVGLKKTTGTQGVRSR